MDNKLKDNKPFPSEDVLREAIFNAQEPLLFKNILQDSEHKYIWKLLQWNVEELAEQFGDDKLPFRIGYNAKSNEPQWESQSAIKEMTMTEFIELNKCSNVDIKWYYFDYKHMNEWLKDKPEILSSLNWHMFGLDKKGEDSTIWIGNKGAHTNCHQDSYGCNLVAQIHGRKQWLLFPPNSNNEIKPIRVPYEESTIYSSYNFFCPTEDEETVLINKIENPRSVTLEAGDALLIPKGWWHYVESLDLSVSVNVWLPLETDNQERLKEALVKLIITGIEKTFCSESEDRQCTVPYCMKLIEATLDKCKYQYQNDTQEGLLKTNKKMKYSNERPTWKVQEITTEYMNYIKFIPILKIDEFKALLMEKRCRFSSVINEVKQGHSDSILVNKNISKKVINALCHPNIINQIAETLLNVTDRNK